MLPADTRVLADPAALAAEACRLIEAAAQTAIGERKVFRLLLAGGSTPGLAYRLLGATQQNWPAWEIFWGDERCLPVDDPARNDRMARELWLARAAIPERNIHPIAAEIGAEQAAADYAGLIAGKQPFDLAILGMGEDGHTASLFPGRQNDAAPVVAVSDAPKPPAGRVSLGFSVLRACRAQLVLVSGAAKSQALAAWRRGDDLPIARAVRSDACLLVDESLRGAIGEAAASRGPNRTFCS
jgi:6-phosphogluconolactonase